MIWKITVLLGLVCAVVFVALSFHFARTHAEALPSRVGAPPADFPAPMESVILTTEDGIKLHGWYAAPPGSTRAIVLLHQYGGNRLSMLSRARLFCAQGYAVLLYDARGHGESEGETISLGYRERSDLLAALDFLRRRGMTSLACVGWSQGGSTIMMAAGQLPDVRAVVLESAFDTFARAIDRGFRKHTGLPGWLTGWLYTLRTEQLLGFPIEAFRPIDHIADLACPVFVISGTEDTSTWASDTLEIYEAAQEPKELWMVPGADHQDLYAFAPTEYERRVLAFLERYL